MQDAETIEKPEADTAAPADNTPATEPNEGDEGEGGGE